MGLIVSEAINLEVALTNDNVVPLVLPRGISQFHLVSTGPLKISYEKGALQDGGGPDARFFPVPPNTWPAYKRGHISAMGPLTLYLKGQAGTNVYVEAWK